MSNQNEQNQSSPDSADFRVWKKNATKALNDAGLTQAANDEKLLLRLYSEGNSASGVVQTLLEQAREASKRDNLLQG